MLISSLQISPTNSPPCSPAGNPKVQPFFLETLITKLQEVACTEERLERFAKIGESTLPYLQTVNTQSFHDQYTKALQAANEGLAIPSNREPNILADLFRRKSNAHNALDEPNQAHTAAEDGLASVADPAIRANLFLEKVISLIKLEKSADALKAATEGLAIPGVTNPNILAELERLKRQVLENTISETKFHKRNAQFPPQPSSRPLKNPRKQK